MPTERVEDYTSFVPFYFKANKTKMDENLSDTRKPHYRFFSIFVGS